MVGSCAGACSAPTFLAGPTGYRTRNYTKPLTTLADDKQRSKHPRLDKQEHTREGKPATLATNKAEKKKHSARAFFAKLKFRSGNKLHS